MSNYRPAVKAAYNWVAQFVDPLRLGRAMKGLAWYARDYRAYRRHPGAERIRLVDLMPALHERSATHDVDVHYFYVNPWAVRRILSTSPALHVDVGSQTVLSTMLSASVPTLYIDYRLLAPRLDGMATCAGDLLRLPLRSNSVHSLSCLHVAEHVGLGRYGDPLDPAGTRKAAAELMRILAPGGSLFFAVPVGKPRVVFNAHRIHSAATVRHYFAALRLLEFSGVDDGGHFREHLLLDDLDGNDYGCGFFWFTKE